MSPRRSSQRTSRKRQRQACLEDADFMKPCKMQVTDENVPPNASRKPTREPCPQVPIAEGSSVLCRQQETSKLDEMLYKSINDDHGAAIYIPGQPGTGKTHTVRSVVASLVKHDLARPLPACALINCQDASSSLPRICLAGLREAHAVMGTHNSRGAKALPIVAGDACKLPSACNNTEAISEMRKFVNGSKNASKSSKACKTTEQAVQKIFSLSAAPSSRLVVIGIANRLDLAHRVLQPVGATGGNAIKPTIIAFHSYSARQLLELLQAQYPNTFEAKALELVARRVSAVSGDMRSAMAVCASARATAARAATAALASPSAPVPGSPTRCGSAAPRALITVSQVAAALAACKTGGGAEAQGHIKLIQALPVQQQLLVCTLAIARGGAAGAAAAPSPKPSATPTATSRSALTATPRPLLSTARTPTAAHTPPLSAQRQGNLHSLLASQSQTPVGAGFGLATPRPASKPVFKSFPMADDVPGMTPSSSVAVTAVKGRARQAAMSMEAVYRKYTGSGKEAGIAVVDWPGLEMLVGLLCETGLLEVTRGRGKGRRGQLCKDALVKLKVSTDDVKHALASSHLLLPLVAQLP